MKHWKPITIALIIVMAFSVMGATCGPSGHVVQYAYTTAIWSGDEPNMTPYVETSLVPSHFAPYPEVCSPVPSDVSDRKDLCRALQGVESTGDHRNWIIYFTADGRPGGGPPTGAQLLGADWAYGLTFTTEAGTTYEGCYWRSPDDSYVCDYRSSHQYVMSNHIDGGWGMGWVLGNAWYWAHHELASDIGCAKGIAASLAKRRLIDRSFLLACSDGPQES